ncbi:hypothetical protein MLD38_019356 [Melastoma candidum]|uniref:Uncharacterized protein n=1 Tax=Melastoma candidum TaxID=119954 RepID=A0ACB9QWR6_9MYRT|nr:hypothetical protein MLD38_019356 [Melastoma candidum]
MRSLIAPNPTRFNLGITQIRKSPFLLDTRSDFLPRIKYLPASKVCELRPLGASASVELVDCGGWEDLQLVGDPSQWGESAQLRKFLAYLGIDDKRFAVVFLLGFVCALSVSRIRVCSIVVIPAGLLLFAAGVSIGLIWGGGRNWKGLKDEASGGEVGERGAKIAALFEDVSSRVIKLRSDIKNAIECNRVSVDDLERYAEELDLIGHSASDGGDSVKDAGTSVDGVVQKDTRKKVWFWEFIGGRFRGEQAIAKSEKVKVQNAKTRVKNPKTDGDGPPAQASKEAVQYGYSDDVSFHSVSSQGVGNGEVYDANYGRRQQRAAEQKGSSSVNEIGGGGGNRRFADSEEFVFHRDRFEYLKSESVYVKGNRGYGCQSSVSQDNMLDFGEHIKTNDSFSRDQSIKKSTGRYQSHRGRGMTMNANANFSDDELEGGYGSRIWDDVGFDNHLKEANALFRQAKELVREKYYDENTDMMLSRSAGLLSRAIEMKPMNLLAVGLLGDDGSFPERRRTVRGKDEIASRLIQACEECEELLVKAGRKYKLVLLIDGDDARALYNWGLALSFRAQLISDIGPEAALDADKVFLAAIDKFNAMLSRGKAYAPDALFRWGVVLQQRSRLQLRTISEKVKLLKQAKRLYEDALDMDSGNPRVKEALSACMFELNDHPLSLT